MSDPDQQHQSGTRDARLEQDEFHLYGWVNGTNGSRIGRRASDRATPDHNPTDHDHEQSTLVEVDSDE